MTSKITNNDDNLQADNDFKKFTQQIEDCTDHSEIGNLSTIIDESNLTEEQKKRLFTMIDEKKYQVNKTKTIKRFKF